MNSWWWGLGWFVAVLSVAQVVTGVLTLAWPLATPPWRRRFTVSRLWGWTRIVAGAGGLLIVSDLWIDASLDGLGLALRSAGFVLLIASNFMSQHASLARVPPEPEQEPEPESPTTGAEPHGVLY